MMVQFASNCLLVIRPRNGRLKRLCAAALLLATALLLAAAPVFAAAPCRTAAPKELPPDALPEEVEAALVEALARSLQGFEECLPEVAASPLVGNAGRQGGASGAGSGSGGAYGSGEGQGGEAAFGRTGQDGQRGAYGDNSFPSSSAPGGRSVADGAGSQSSREYDASRAGAGSRGAYGSGAVAQSPYDRGTNTPQGGVRTGGCGGTPCPDPSTEDDVARKLRRAAEVEPNPEVRRQLWAQYHRYMNP